MKITKATIEKVKELPISSVLEKSGVALKRIGREYLVKCPWHKDTNPSLTVNDDKNLCFCFVCKGGNDSIAFIQQKFGLSFIESVEKIADLFNIQVEYDNIDPEIAAKAYAKRQNDLQILKNEQDQYRANLKDPRATRIRDILVGRGIEPATAKHFGIGFASKGFFAGRITVPVHNHKGELVGFTARATKEDQTPKYKNSATSELFDKGRLIYNEFNAVSEIIEADSVVFVEGHFDVIMMWQHGIRNAVATQGTGAPDPASIERLARKTKRFILCFDSDDGGKKAIEQFLRVAGPMACEGKISINIAEMPDGTDPDECLRSESCDLYHVINNAKNWLDWQIDEWLANLDRTDTTFFAKAERLMRELIERIQSPALRQFYIDKASKALIQEPSGAARLAQQWHTSLPAIAEKKHWEKPDVHYTRKQAEKRLIRLYIHAPEMRDLCRPLLDRIETPSLCWLKTRIRELEEYGIDPSSNALMSILSIAENHYVTQLRAITMPTIKINKSPGILRHIEDTLYAEVWQSNEDLEDPGD